MRILFGLEVLGVAAFIAGISTLCAYSLFWSLQAAPSFSSLRLVSGVVTTVYECSGAPRNVRTFKATINANDGNQTLSFPCVKELDVLKDLVGTPLEIRVASNFFFWEQITDIWDVRSAEHIYYHYGTRAVRHAKVAPYLAVIWVGFLIVLLATSYKYFTYARRRWREKAYF